MKVIKKLTAGMPGTKFYTKLYGKNLVCIRHRHDPDSDTLHTTVELIVTSRKPKGSYQVQSSEDHGAPVDIKIEYEERELRQRAKQAGARWMQDTKSWRMPYSTAVKLGLLNRILAIHK
jgi:hypothetical protein